VDWFHQYNALPAEVNPSGKAAFVGNLELAKTWSDYYGRPVHVGEFGCYEQADAVSRANFYRDMRETLDRLGLGWAMWDWKAGFKYWDGPQNRPAPGLPEAIFPRQTLRVMEAGHLQTESAVGKRQRIFRATDLATPLAGWTPVFDEALASPLLDFADPNPPAGHAFYVVEWVK
jgi:hypothetical protein